METFVDACKADPFYETIKANSQNPEKKGLGYTEDKETGLSTTRNCVTQEFVHCVTGYDINDHFVKPWTHGKGNSVALLMNPIPKRAEVMLSHAWGEDIEEVMQVRHMRRAAHFLHTLPSLSRPHLMHPTSSSPQPVSAPLPLTTLPPPPPANTLEPANAPARPTCAVWPVRRFSVR